jgi:leader peptidase (prepilin peptidase)/N-methyltransferase
MTEFYNVIIPVVLGLITGSFLNVCIYRLPENKSIITPRSHCPFCKHTIAWYDNIPVLSYIFLFGKCRHCNSTIPLQYPLVEALTALLMYLISINFPPLVTAGFWVYSAFVSSLIVITFIDLKYYIIPDVITLPGIPVGILASWFLTNTGTKNSLIGAGVGFFFLLFVAEGYKLLTKKDGMGGGDIKLAGMIGAFTGWDGVIFSILVGSLTGAVVGSIFLIINKKDSQTPVPFGPFLSFGAVLFLLAGRGWMNLLMSIRY